MITETILIIIPLWLIALQLRDIKEKLNNVNKQD